METNWVKKKKIFSKTWFFLIIVFLIATLSLTFLVLWVKWAFAAPNTSGKEIIFVIAENESTLNIAKRLKEKNLIRDSNAFRIYSRINCKGIDLTDLSTVFKKYPSKDCLSGNIQAGSFKLSQKMDLPTLTLHLTKGRLDSWIRIVEGLRNEEIGEKLEKKYNFKKEEFLNFAQIGYMFPDTYLFKVNTTAKEVADKMRLTFDQKFDQNTADKIKSQGLTIDKGVILASIVERESKNTNERPIIAGILLKRLRNNWKLEVDATIQYALGYDNVNETWWTKVLTDSNLKIDSPFNTRKNFGLPPTPICNPGLSALKAIAEPIETDYYFYLHDSKGEVHFAKTLKEHNDNKIKYL